jgi:hypothetical protein
MVHPGYLGGLLVGAVATAGLTVPNLVVAQKLNQSFATRIKASLIVSSAGRFAMARQAGTWSVCKGEHNVPGPSARRSFRIIGFNIAFFVLHAINVSVAEQALLAAIGAVEWVLDCVEGQTTCVKLGWECCWARPR